jgi:hypothetical protein
MFDWAVATDTLYRLSKTQIGKFFNGPEVEDVYGVGFFCDAYSGSVYLVANTEQSHQSTLCDFQARFGPTDPEVFKWDIGNWKYPGGLFPSSASEQVEFDTGWEEYREPLSKLEDEKKQDKIEKVCINVLSILFKEGAFSTALSLTWAPPTAR